MMDISVLRFLGIGVGVATLLLVFYRLREPISQQKGIWLLFLFGLSLLLVGLFPGLASLPSDLFRLRTMRGGRLISLLVISTIILWAIIISERLKADRMQQQFDRLFRYTVQREFSRQLGPEETCPILIVIPAFNEVDNLRSLLPRIPQALRGQPVKALVVDDGSTDGTEEAARRHGALVVSFPVNRGGGAALRSGYDAARSLQASVVVTIDADGQHAPEEIEGLVAPILEGQADIVIGSRILGSCERYSAFRWLGVVVFSRLISLLMGIRVADCSSGFRAFRREALELLLLRQDQYHTAELIIEAAKRHLRIVERPVAIRARLSGQSKKGADLLYGLRFLRTVLFTWWR